MHQRHLNMQQLSTNGVQHQRRRKKRPNYGTRTVEVHRGFNGFGFTISGQQPCRLSCIVADSPADQAGLRNGDFLISINGLNVSKLPHETVVQLIGNSFGSIRMQIAENYYSDSSDEENAAAANATQQQQQQQQQQQRQMQQQQQHQMQQTYNSSNWRGAKPRYLHHRIKMQQRMRNSPQKKRAAQQLLLLQQQQQQQQQRQQQCEALAINAVSTCAAAAALEIQSLRPLMEDMPLPLKHNSGSSSNRSHKSVSPNVANVSAMVRVPTAALEYRAIVGYMGTIEMPKQISHSSKLQTVRSCIRKLRQEKRQPTTVLMTILPDCLRLQSANGNILASYNSSRLNYVSASSESENRFFGLITSAVHTDDKDEDLVDDLATDEAANTPGCHISISNSCHVFVVDTKICEHQQHLTRANEFRILCTRDPISSLCLEFPNNSEYVVNLIRSMYTMRIIPPATRHLPPSNAHINDERAMGAAAAHSPQPSNHSEISTTTSNSDSGIGFHNDCSNISDRILVVDFPGVHELRMRHAAARPAAIFNNFDPAAASVNCNSGNNNNNNNNNIDKRLTVRAMPDPKTPTLNRPDLLANFSLIKSPANSLTATRSCDDVLALMERGFHAEQQQLHQRSDDETGDLTNAQLTHASMNDISLHATASNTAVEKYEQHIFLHPTVYTQLPRPSSNMHTPSKLSPQVFCTPPKTANNNMELKHNKGNNHLETAKAKAKATRYSIGFQAVDVSNKRAPLAFSFDLDTWSSLQNLHENVNKSNDLEITNSEPDLGNQVVPAHTSPFRRAWGQSSFRTSRNDKSNTHADTKRHSPLLRRSVSMTASDNDVYLKSSMDASGDIKDELKQAHSQQQIATVTKTVHNSNSNSSKFPQVQISKPDASSSDATGTGVSTWGTSFERLLEDAAGLQTFAEFLKKEFSAENIYFWTACERFRQLENVTERAAQALAIFNKHLANGALEPVNVDSQARNLTEEKLTTADLDIFAHAQKQIFNLMKFDSYPRFIRSDLYKSCLEAEQKRQALPYNGEDLDELLKTNFHQSTATKLKKTASNAEDRRRKSLLPWHRKTRSKSRDRPENETNAKIPNQIQITGVKLPQLTTSSSLKIPSLSHNSASDIHSSRSSLSSFDALPTQTNGQFHDVCSLCRIILSDGATTIVQTRPGESVGQMVERLLEKRGLCYQYYDVVINGSSKSIDLNSLAQSCVAGKEVVIEQRVAFKLDLPDPKVISVKSKPKKQLHEVIRPILQKYNYKMDGVQVLMRDTRAILDLSLPVTVADGQRLQIVLLNGSNANDVKFLKPAIPKSVSFPKPSLLAARNGATSQSTLDEITNKVFNELLQGKVEAHERAPLAQPQDLSSLKSDDCASETSSSIFERMRRRETNIPVFKLKSKKKSTSSQHSEESGSTQNSNRTETLTNSNNNNNMKSATSTTILTTTTSNIDVKKPIIAKLKAGVKLQLTERVAEQQDELLEGLKRAQLARLEDQRGTEINSELPDFLKNKDNISISASKLRKVRANLSPLPKSQLNEDNTATALNENRPQPAPRLSITNKQKATATPPIKNNMRNGLNISPRRIDDEPKSPNSPSKIINMETDIVNSGRGPPPLPPKPKVLPIKPSNWSGNACNKSPSATSIRKVSLSNDEAIVTSVTSRCAFLEEPSSSFV